MGTGVRSDQIAQRQIREAWPACHAVRLVSAAGPTSRWRRRRRLLGVGRVASLARRVTYFHALTRSTLELMCSCLRAVSVCGVTSVDVNPEFFAASPTSYNLLEKGQIRTAPCCSKQSYEQPKTLLKFAFRSYFDGMHVAHSCCVVNTASGEKQIGHRFVPCRRARAVSRKIELWRFQRSRPDSASRKDARALRRDARRRTHPAFSRRLAIASNAPEASAPSASASALASSCACRSLLGARQSRPEPPRRPVRFGSGSDIGGLAGHVLSCLVYFCLCWWVMGDLGAVDSEITPIHPKTQAADTFEVSDAMSSQNQSSGFVQR